MFKINYIFLMSQKFQVFYAMFTNVVGLVVVNA